MIADALSPDGIAPPYLAKVHGEDEPASAGWCDASVTAPWALWVHYADRRSLELGYEGARRFIDTIDEHNPNGVSRKKYVANFGDWLSARMTIPPGATDWTSQGGSGAPRELFAAAWWTYSADLVSQMAAALGKADESRHYAARAGKIREALIHGHIRPDGTITGNEQSCYTLALGMNHLQGELRDKAETRLLEAIQDDDEHLATGSITTIFLLNFWLKTATRTLRLGWSCSRRAPRTAS